MVWKAGPCTQQAGGIRTHLTASYRKHEQVTDTTLRWLHRYNEIDCQPLRKRNVIPHKILKSLPHTFRFPCKVVVTNRRS